MKLLFFEVALMAFALSATAGDVPLTPTRHSCCAAAEPAPAPALSDKSIYQLDAAWTNDEGRKMTLADLKGRPQIVTMFFAHCQYACPLLVYKMQQIEAVLPENLRTNIGFTLVSFDSERDTPSALHSYRAEHKLAGNWTLLHGSADDVLGLSALLGVKFKKDALGQFMHSNVITVLNAEGEIAYQESGLDLDPAEIVRHLQKLVNRKSQIANQKCCR